MKKSAPKIHHFFTVSFSPFTSSWLFFLLGGGEGDSSRRQEEGGGWFLLKIPGGGVSRAGGGAQGRWGGRVFGNWGEGGSKYFFSGPKCPPSYGVVIHYHPVVGRNSLVFWVVFFGFYQKTKEWQIREKHPKTQHTRKRNTPENAGNGPFRESAFSSALAFSGALCSRRPQRGRQNTPKNATPKNADSKNGWSPAFAGVLRFPVCFGACQDVLLQPTMEIARFQGFFRWDQNKGVVQGDVHHRRSPWRRDAFSLRFALALPKIHCGVCRPRCKHHCDCDAAMWWT